MDDCARRLMRGQTAELLDGAKDVLDQLQLHAYDGAPALKRTLEAIRKRHDLGELKIAVLALAKSGKSTLLNALTASSCLPSSNVPETSRICRLVHAEVPQPALYINSQKVMSGAPNICNTLRSLNEQARIEHSGPAGTDASASLEIQLPFAALEGKYDKGALGTVVLLDTPGPNEAGQDHLKEQVERLLGEVDVVMYVLDYTKLKTDDEQKLFERLSKFNPQLLQRLAQRLFFVVNKVDVSAKHKGLSLEETADYVAKLVTQQLGGAGQSNQPGQTPALVKDATSLQPQSATEPFRLHPQQVLLVSASNALLSRLHLAGCASDDEREYFLRTAFGEEYEEELEDTPAAVFEEKARKRASRMLEKSGVPGLERRVMTYLADCAFPIKGLATVDDCAMLLRSTQQALRVYLAALRVGKAELDAKCRALDERLKEVLSEYECAEAESEHARADADAEVRRRCGQLEEDLKGHVRSLLAQAGLLEGDNSSNSAPATGPMGRLRGLLQAVCQLGRGGDAARDNLSAPAATELRTLLQEVHDEVVRKLHEASAATSSAVADFLREADAQLVRHLNSHLDALTRVMEAAVGQVFQVHMEPLDQEMAERLRSSSAAPHLPSADALLQQGLAQGEAVWTRMVPEWHIRKVTRFGLDLFIVKFFPYQAEVREEVEVQRVERVAYTRVQAHVVVAHFEDMVHRAVAASREELQAHVQHYCQQRLRAARKKLEDCKDRFTVILARAQADHASSGKDKAKVEGQVAFQEGEVARLLRRAASLQQYFTRFTTPTPAQQPHYAEHQEPQDTGTAAAGAAAAATDAAAATAASSDDDPPPVDAPAAADRAALNQPLLAAVRQAPCAQADNAPLSVVVEQRCDAPRDLHGRPSHKSLLACQSAQDSTVATAEAPNKTLAWTTATPPWSYSAGQQSQEAEAVVPATQAEALAVSKVPATNDAGAMAPATPAAQASEGVSPVPGMVQEGDGSTLLDLAAHESAATHIRLPAAAMAMFHVPATLVASGGVGFQQGQDRGSGDKRDDGDDGDEGDDWWAVSAPPQTD